MKLCVLLLLPLVATGKYERDVCLIESYPFLVKIIKKETTQEVFHCSAAILSERWVITPASCCYLSYLPNLYYIVAGSNIGNDLRGRQFLPIKQMKVHPLYTRGQPKNDVCLIYTEVEFKLSKYVSYTFLSTFGNCKGAIVLSFSTYDSTEILNKELQCLPAELLVDECGSLGYDGVFEQCVEVEEDYDMCMGDPIGIMVCEKTKGLLAFTHTGLIHCADQNSVIVGQKLELYESYIYESINYSKYLQYSSRAAEFTSSRLWPLLLCAFR